MDFGDIGPEHDPGPPPDRHPDQMSVSYYSKRRRGCFFWLIPMLIALCGICALVAILSSMRGRS